MKGRITILAFLVAFTLAATAQPASQSSGLISKRQLASMIENAKTMAEHQQIADYYRAESIRLLAESNKHASMGADYARNPAKGVHNLYDHCAYLTKDFKAKSVKATELAAQHERMAKDAAAN